MMMLHYPSKKRWVTEEQMQISSTPMPGSGRGPTTSGIAMAQPWAHGPTQEMRNE